jgi:hypothetical protein
MEILELKIMISYIRKFTGWIWQLKGHKRGKTEVNLKQRKHPRERTQEERILKNEQSLGEFLDYVKQCNTYLIRIKEEARKRMGQGKNLEKSGPNIAVLMDRNVQLQNVNQRSSKINAMKLTSRSS